MTPGYRQLSVLLAAVGFVVGFLWMAVGNSSIAEDIVEGVYFALVGAGVALLLSWMGAGVKKSG